MLFRALTILMLLGFLFTPPSMRGSSISYPFETRTLVQAYPVALVAGGVDNATAGRLRYLGGWDIRSRNPNFSGLSSLSVMPLADGGISAIALSDRARVIRFQMDAAGQMTFSAIADIEDRPVPLRFWGNRDTESLLHDPTGGGWWVGYERQNQIWLYDATFGKVLGKAPLPGPYWTLNGGPEALAMLPDGRIAVFAEDVGDDARSAVLIYPASPLDAGARPLTKWVYPPRGYSITDATVVGERLFLILRDFDLAHGFRSMLAMAPVAAFDGEAVRPEILADLSRYDIDDNFEGISAYRVDRQTIIWGVSDNNANGVQRTLLLKFALPD